jgi:hypothetical protein
MHQNALNRGGDIFTEPPSFCTAYDILGAKAISLPDNACASTEVSSIGGELPMLTDKHSGHLPTPKHYKLHSMGARLLLGGQARLDRAWG